MKLTFSLLVVDDDPSSVDGEISELKDYLAENGFDLDKETAIIVKERFKKLAETQGANYDLVMIDYNLGVEGFNGIDAVLQFKRLLPYTEMLFYSGTPEKELLKEIYEAEITGIFVSGRNNLTRTLEGLAKTIIRKAVDLNHMRGIAMAEVAEMDLLMKETLEFVFHNKSNKQIQDISTRTICKLLKYVRKGEKFLEKINQDNFSDLINNNQLFTLAYKFKTILELSQGLQGENKDDLKIYRDEFQKEIITNRNLLAHVKEKTVNSGNSILCTDKGDKIIDDEWMKNFRIILKKHSMALDKMCNSVKEKYGTCNAEHVSQED